MFRGTFLSCFKILPFKATKYVLEHPEVFQFHKRPRRLSHQGYHSPFHKHSENSAASLTRSWLTEKVKVSLKEQALRRQTALPHVLFHAAVVFSAASSPSPLTREGLNKSPGTERNCHPFLARQPQCSARVCAIIQPLTPISLFWSITVSHTENLCDTNSFQEKQTIAKDKHGEPFTATLPTRITKNLLKRLKLKILPYLRRDGTRFFRCKTCK